MPAAVLQEWRGVSVHSEPRWARWVEVGSLGQLGAGSGSGIGCSGMGFWEGCAWGSSQSDVRMWVR